MACESLEPMLIEALAGLCECYNMTISFYEVPEPPPKVWWQFWK